MSNLTNLKGRRCRPSSADIIKLKIIVTNPYFVGQKLDLVFEKSNKLVDDNFVYIERDGNSSRLVEDYHKLASKFDDCFYRNINSALDICDGNIVSVTLNVAPRMVKL